ncbi:MAG: cation diffusion facilitator CzcD-associated flavoprotein CzcO [Gammaproteobacteria bacterium]|jgi:cation diffusion facilitator CzcD-associated flavoprotein CzcO
MSAQQSANSNEGQSQTHFDVVIVGAGFSGLLCTSYLTEAGIDNVRVFEMTPSVGGVWSHGGVGAYPGAACDVPSYMYLPFLDRTGFIPSKKYVSQPEIANYAEMLTDHVGIRDKIRFSRKVVELKYLGNGADVWQITTVDAQSGKSAEAVTSQHVVSANGPLSSPRMPEFGGMELFKGESFHTAKWDKNANLAGKRVAVIGTGASAAQVITTIADDVESLHVFQRTPTWCLRREDEPTPPDIEAQFRAGGYGEKLRYVDWKGEFPPGEVLIDFDALHDEEQNEAICAQLREFIDNDVDDPELAKLLTPDYPFFCKRALFIDDYFTTFNKPNVTLVHDEGGVVRVDETGLWIARDEHFEFDVIIYATGFDSNFIPFPIFGRDGASLADKFGALPANKFQMTRPHSLWGIHVDEMPNFYMMIGPQSLNPVTNVTLLCEQQSKYIADLVAKMAKANHREVEPLKKAVDQWSDLCTSTAEGKVWLRCNNWYLKTTKTDTAAGRERSSGMWMDTYEEYLHHVLGGKGGSLDELLEYS